MEFEEETGTMMILIQVIKFPLVIHQLLTGLLNCNI